MPKTEAINGRLVSKCTAHIRSGKILFMENKVTAVYCSTFRGYHTLKRSHVTTWYRREWLLCIKGFLLLSTTVKGHHVLSLEVLCQKRKPQIDGVF